MRLERTPAFNLLIPRNQNPAETGTSFDGATYWEGQLSNQETFQQWWSLAKRISQTTVGRSEDAEDVASIAVMTALTRGGTFRGGNPRAWFLRVVTSKSYNELRRRMRQPSLSLELNQEESGTEVEKNTGKDPDKAARGSLVNKAIAGELRKLSQDQREVLILCDMNGLSYEEAAEQTRTALGTVKSRLSRGRAKTRQGLSEQGIGSDFFED